jgi:hypothetical protein
VLHCQLRWQVLLQCSVFNDALECRSHALWVVLRFKKHAVDDFVSVPLLLSNTSAVVAAADLLDRVLVLALP